MMLDISSCEAICFFNLLADCNMGWGGVQTDIRNYNTKSGMLKSSIRVQNQATQMAVLFKVSPNNKFQTQPFKKIMKSLKTSVTTRLMFITFLILLCQHVDVQQFNSYQEQQKHFTTLQSKHLYLSKSLSSREDLTLPLDRVFSISSIHSSSQVIKFTPTTVKLLPQKRSTFIQFQKKYDENNQPLFGREILSPQTISANQSILHHLRTPLPHQISQIVVLNQKLTFLFVFPAKVIIFEQMANTFTITNTYQIKQFISKSPQMISFYPLGDQYVIANVYETNQFYLFNSKGYKMLQNQAQIGQLEHVHTFDVGSLEFFSAERENGFKHCRVNVTNNKIEIVKKFQNTDDLSLNLYNLPFITDNKELQIYDISFNRESSEIYILDINLGVIKFKYASQSHSDSPQLKYQIVPNTTSLIIRQRGCQALDYIPNDRLVLICEQRKRRFFIEAYYNHKLQIYQKQSPVFHNCNFQDLHVTKDYYVAFEQSSVDVFWPSKNNFIPQTAHNKKHINLLGMQAYQIFQNSNNLLCLYSIRNNVLIKEKLEEERYSLSIGSVSPVRKSFKIQVFGSCSSIFFNLNDKKKHSLRFNQEQINKLKQRVTQITPNSEQSYQLCKISIPIELQTSRYIFENRGKFSLAMGILMICILISFTLICICMKKYLGLERAAQQTLQKLRNGETINPQFVL